MKSNKKSAKKTTTFKSLQQFKEFYFPITTADEKLRGKIMEDDYGNIIAMSILNGIKRDLTGLHK